MTQRCNKRVLAGRGRRGSTLIEVIIATMVVSLVMVAVVSVLTVSIRNTSIAKQRAVATKYSSEAMEFFHREVATMGWETFLSTIQAHGSAVTYCLATIPADDAAFIALPVGNCTAAQTVDPRSLYTRSAVVTIAPSNGGGSPSQATVVITLTWKDNSLTHTSTLTEVLHDYNAPIQYDPAAY